MTREPNRILRLSSQDARALRRLLHDVRAYSNLGEYLRLKPEEKALVERVRDALDTGSLPRTGTEG